VVQPQELLRSARALLIAVLTASVWWVVLSADDGCTGERHDGCATSA
jgi:hypothetical protein